MLPFIQIHRCNIMNSKLLITIILMVFSMHVNGQIFVDTDWLSINEKSLEIIPGSALDFSSMFSDQMENGIIHPVTSDSSGHLAIKGRQQRFMCAPMILTPPYGGFPDHETSDRYALQLKRSGYNLARIMMIDATLMTQHYRDFEYDPIQLDRFYYFLFSLKRQGIYWMLDAMSSDNASYGDVKPHRWVYSKDIKRRIYFDNHIRQHWRRQVEILFGSRNPYTGISPLNDPALMGLILFNESGLQFLTHLGKKIPDEARAPISHWLKNKYKPEDFEKVWGQPFARLENSALELPSSKERSARMDDVLDFYLETQRETAKWMTGVVREFGFNGLITAYNNMPTTHADRTRAEFNWVDMHAYHDEGFGFIRGSRIHNTSMFDNYFNMLTQLAMSRLAGRAFTVSEYGQPFWNAQRREMAIIPAYAALHDWDAICQHASTAVDFGYANTTGWKQYITPYAVGLDPVARAVETLSVFLFRRGDVSRSPTYTEIVLPGGEAESAARYWGIDRKLASIALTMRTQTTLNQEAAPFNEEKPIARITIDHQSPSHIKINNWLEKNIPSPIHDALNALTNAPQNTYHSSTDEILIDYSTRHIEIRTPKSVAAIVEHSPRSADLGFLKILSLSHDALVALSSLDNQPLTHSKRMLLIIAADALNTGQQFTDTSRKELVEIGHLPPRTPPLQMMARLATKGVPLQISQLAQSGEIVGQENFTSNDFHINWLTQPHGPTIYYLITINPSSNASSKKPDASQSFNPTLH